MDVEIAEHVEDEHAEIAKVEDAPDSASPAPDAAEEEHEESYKVLYLQFHLENGKSVRKGDILSADDCGDSLEYFLEIGAIVEVV